ncbi:trypco2 family protein [Actinacidiphila epipremni]|uniref:Trypsin-co-occurring domain-containing protein n=1 Tax=Actinacidiphila epipremni TaxID=2053013 RepID=A0ABX0ZKN8_9ACTN|nr:trypco2 family protein [Actinacidiphila epipremni]NJP42218.1 hypothetical protein [Actinacidiphila epipremni]
MEEPSEPSFVGLAEVIAQIRGELEQARTAAEGERIGFTVEKVSLEFTVQVHRTGRAGGGLRIGVVTAELGGTVDRGTTHRVQVELEPHEASGRVNVSRPRTGR